MIKVDTSGALGSEVHEKHKVKIAKGEEWLDKGNDPLAGWVKLPANYDKGQLAKIVKTAEKIKEQCDAFVVIGIGGSYLGARAAIEMMGHTFKRRVPEVYFAGYNLSGTYHAELIEEIKEKDISICMISKSGSTIEPNIAFAIFKELLIDKYGEIEARKRIYVITDAKKGILRDEVKKEGYENFNIPDDIPGRYSVLTPVGLLPMAVAGIDIYQVMEGAAVELSESQSAKYAATRFSLIEKGKLVEIFEYYEPKLHYFVEWLKQLFGESEGKNGKGLFPAGLKFTTDLHSMGQFLQEGNQIFFETVLNVEYSCKDLEVPKHGGGSLGEKSVNIANKAAMVGVVQAHGKNGIPIIKIDIPELTPFSFGQMVYFFEKSCALTCCLMEVNPFDQPGVESYKTEMRKVLKFTEN